MRTFTRNHFILLLGIISLGLCSCKPHKAKEIPIVQSITFMTVGWPDSSTKNHAWMGIDYYAHFDLTNNRVSLYTKLPAGNPYYDYKRFRTDTIISNLTNNNAIKEFIGWTKSYDFQGHYKEEMQWRAHPPELCFCDYLNFFVKIKTDSGEKVIAYSSRWKQPNFEKPLELLPKWSEANKWKTTSKALNEDSILVPILSLPYFDSIFTHVPPPPPPSYLKTDDIAPETSI